VRRGGTTAGFPPGRLTGWAAAQDLETWRVSDNGLGNFEHEVTEATEEPEFLPQIFADGRTPAGLPRPE
jgi:hypothetical protein